MPKYSIFTFGCAMNASDSERIERHFERNGWKKSLDPDDSDLVIVNMCSVRQSAVNRVFGRAGYFSKLKKNNPKLKTLLTGCFLKHDFENLKQIFDIILPVSRLAEFSQAVKKGKKRHVFLGRPVKEGIGYLKEEKAEKKTTSFIPVSIGCDSFCTYCVVPFVRGKETCRPAKDIVKEARKSIRQGSKEIWLLGENINSYRFLEPSGKMIDFADLLKMIDEIPGRFWIRFISSHPKYFSEKLIETIANSKKATKYLSLPVQSGDEEILKRMNRGYTLKEYEKTIEKISKKIPGCFLSTDAIVGFPGETRKQFLNTAKLFKKTKFDMAYISQYSPRRGTLAFRMKDTVSDKEKEKREKELNEILKKTAFEKNKGFIGKTVEVLPQSFKNGILTGKTKEYKTIKIEGPASLIGKFVKAEVIGCLAWGLKGKIKKGARSPYGNMEEGKDSPFSLQGSENI